MLNTGYCMRLVGTCDFHVRGAGGEGGGAPPTPAPTPSLVGVGAHGGQGQGQGQGQGAAAFTAFKCLAVARDRVAFVEGTMGAPSAELAALALTLPTAQSGSESAPTGTAAAAAEPAADVNSGEFAGFNTGAGMGSSWTFSSSLSPAELAKIQGMLGGSDEGGN